MFDVGDIVKGTDRGGYGITNERMKEAEVTSVGDYMTIKILKHENEKAIGRSHIVNPMYFELVAKRKLPIGGLIKMFKAGELIKGTKSNPYNQTGYGMLKARVLEHRALGNVLKLEILEHTNPNFVDTVCTATYKEGYFEYYADQEAVDKIDPTLPNVKVVEEVNAKFIIIDDRYTICIPKDAPHGIAIRDIEDNVNEEMGKALAYFRTAKQQTSHKDVVLKGGLR